MDIYKPRINTAKPKMDISKSDKDISRLKTDIDKPKKDHRSYFVLAFVLCIVLFVFFGWQLVKNDNDTKTIEDNLKAELLKNPVKTNIPSASDQTASQSASQASASSQMMQDSASSETRLNQDAATNLAGTEPQNIASSTASTESTENKKFESTKLKVSFDYPKDVSVAEGSNLITVSKDKISWKIRFYDNKNKKDFQAWYTDHFNIKTEADCTFTDATIKVGSYESKLVKPSSDTVKCDGDGSYATNTDKSKVFKVELGKETAENANKILTSFKFSE
jgi:hypothetical protein